MGKNVFIYLLVAALLVVIHYLYGRAYATKVYWFHMPGCKFCVEMKDEWIAVETILPKPLTAFNDKVPASPSLDDAAVYGPKLLPLHTTSPLTFVVTAEYELIAESASTNAEKVLLEKDEPEAIDSTLGDGAIGAATLPVGFACRVHTPFTKNRLAIMLHSQCNKIPHRQTLK